MAPIHPSKAVRYPDDWARISERIRYDRSCCRCECRGECGKIHGSPGSRCTAENGDYATSTRGKRYQIVLTVAHLDHMPENCSDQNLKAMCQACHLRYDAKHHAQNRVRYTRMAMEAAGQGILFHEGNTR